MKGDRSNLETARRVLTAEARAISALVDRLDDRFDAAVEAIIDCTGRVVVTGMGKSGIVCRKIAATFSSTGTPALYLHPGEAAHGDLGGIVPGDVVLCASQSGETEEIVRLLPVIRAVASRLVALCGDASSTLARAADVVIDVAVATEACPLGLAPTASTTATLAMGDALAMAVLERRGFSAEDFGRFHPGGSLGARFLRVADLMHVGTDMPVVTPDMKMREVIHEMTRKGMGMTTVVDGRRLVGIVTDGDLRRLMERVENPLDIAVADVMTRHPRTVSPDLLAARALELMDAPPRRITSLVVVGPANEPLGVLQVQDLWRLVPAPRRGR